MGLTRAAVLRPLFITMIFLAIVVFGLVSYTRLGVNLLPSVNIPVVTVVTAYPGASPDSVESLVTVPLEDALSGLSNLDYISSSSVEGVSTVTLAFTEKANTDASAIDVERKVSSIRSTLPAESKEPTIIKVDLNAAPVLNLALSGPQTPAELSQLADDKIVPRLKTVDGVGSVTVVGGRSREIQVKVNPDRLQAYGLSILQVNAALGAENVNVPGGQISEPDKEYSVRLNALAVTPEQLGNIILAVTPAGNVRLSDVAEVQDTAIKRTLINRSNGNDSIGLLVTKQSAANTISVADGVKIQLARLQPELPSGTRLDTITDESVFTRGSLNGVQRELIQAILLVGAVLLIFLHAWRSTFIVLLAIPTALIGTFVMMNAAGLTLNIMSLLGLTLTIGALVDDSIVVLENIFRHMEMGEKPMDAAISGRSEIGLAAIAITMVDVVVFTPIAFLSGITGQFFRDFGLVVVSAVLLSLFISFTLTPMLASRWLRLPKPNDRSPLAIFGREWERGYSWIVARYSSLLGWSLRHRWPVVAVGVASFVAGISLVALGVVGSEFIPDSDQSEFTLLAEMPPGTPLDVTNRALMTVEQRLTQMPEVDRIFTSVGVADANRPQQSRFGRIVVKLVPIAQRKQSAQALATVARDQGNDVPALKLRSTTPSVAGPAGQAVQIQIKGDAVLQLTDLADKVQKIVESVPGTRDVQSSWKEGQPEVVVQLDRARAADLGISAAQAASAMRTAIAGSVVTQYRPETGKAVDVRVLVGDDVVGRADQIRQLPVATSKGTLVQLGQVATVQEIVGSPQIDRRDRQRLITVAADLNGRPMGDVTNDVEKQLKQLTIPAGYAVQFGGMTQEQRDSFANLGQALALSVLLVYMVTVALYESLLTPFVVLLSLPLAAVGAIGALALSHNSLNIISLIGFIMLAGLVGKNAILLLDYTTTLRKRGMARDEALLEAGPVRLRPILMTATALIIALTPVAIGFTEGSEIRKPIAIPVIGGMITSTLLTLVFIPAVYTLLDDLQLLVQRRLRRKARVPMAAEVDGVGLRSRTPAVSDEQPSDLLDQEPRRGVDIQGYEN